MKHLLILLTGLATFNSFAANIDCVDGVELRTKNPYLGAKRSIYIEVPNQNGESLTAFLKNLSTNQPEVKKTFRLNPYDREANTYIDSYYTSTGTPSIIPNYRHTKLTVFCRESERKAKVLLTFVNFEYATSTPGYSSSTLPQNEMIFYSDWQ